jgi:hypothetical protein
MGPRVLRVAQVATGNAGRLALKQLILDPRFDLVAVAVSDAEKVGADAGELARLGLSTGVEAALGLDPVLDARPDCVVYCAMGDTRLRDAIDDCRRLLAAGINVVGTAPTPLAYPWGVLPQQWIHPIEQAALDGGSSLFVSGVDPGFMNDLIPLALAATCRTVEQVRCMEIADYATYDGSTVMFDVMGFGLPLDETPMLLRPGILSSAWGIAVRQLAAGLGIPIDEIVDSHERIAAPEAFDIAAGHIPKGGAAALRFEVVGMSRGRPAVVIEHVTRLRDDLCSGWARPAQPGGSYRVEIVGEPSYMVDICPTSREGDHNYAAILAGVGRVVNAIPAVAAAEPGILTTLDLPLVAGSGFAVSSGD